MRALLNHPKPYLQESLTSWLWRLTIANYVKSPSVLLHYLRQKHSLSMPSMKRILTKLNNSDQFQGLGILTGADALTIYQLTLHRFAHVLNLSETEDSSLSFMTGESVPLLPEQLHRDVYSSRFSWCPHCLREKNYVRLHWHVPILTCCTHHACWLLDVCPKCGTKPQEKDIFDECCKKCGFVLVTAETIAVPENDLLFKQNEAFMSWLYEPQSQDAALPDVPANILLRVLHGLRYCVQRAGEGWHGHHLPPDVPSQDVTILKKRQLSIYESGCLYSTAFRALLNWPHGFYAFLDDYRQRPLMPEDTGLRVDFGTLYTSWLGVLWNSDEFDWIQNAFNAYILENIPAHQIVHSKRIQDFPELLDQVAYLNLIRAEKYLHSSVYSIYRLVEEGNLKVHPFEGDPDGVWFSRQELDSLKKRWQQYLPIGEVVKQLGLSNRLVRDLLDNQLLEQVPTDAGLKRRSCYVYKRSLRTLTRNLKNHTTIHTGDVADVIGLHNASIRNGSVKLTVTQLLSWVLVGKLKAYHPRETLLPLSEMWFMPQDVDDLSDVVKDEYGWMNKGDVCAFLNVGQRCLRQLLGSGHLSAQLNFGRKLLFARADVESIHEKMIFMNEMSNVLQIPYVSILRLIQEGMLLPLPVKTGVPKYRHIFDRQMFNRWHQRYILYPEIEQITSELEVIPASHRLQTLKPVIEFPKTYLRPKFRAN